MGGEGKGWEEGREARGGEERRGRGWKGRSEVVCVGSEGEKGREERGRGCVCLVFAHMDVCAWCEVGRVCVHMVCVCARCGCGPVSWKAINSRTIEERAACFWREEEREGASDVREEGKRFWRGGGEGGSKRWFCFVLTGFTTKVTWPCLTSAGPALKKLSPRNCLRSWNTSAKTKEAQRQALYRKRLWRSVHTSRKATPPKRRKQAPTPRGGGGGKKNHPSGGVESITTTREESSTSPKEGKEGHTWWATPTR